MDDSDLEARIIRDSFGVAPSVVARVLQRNGACTLGDTLRFLEVWAETKTYNWEFAHFRNSLLILIQHNCASVKLESTRPDGGLPEIRPGEDPSSVPGTRCRYALCRSEIFNRLKYPKFQLLVNSMLGASARLVFSQVIKAGRIQMSTCVRQAQQDPDADVVFGETPPDTSAKALSRSFVELAMRNFIVKVPDLSYEALVKETPKVAPTKSKAAPKRRRRPAGSDNLDRLLGSEQEKPASTAKDDIKMKLKEMEATMSGSSDVYRINSSLLNLEICKELVLEFMVARWSDAPIVRYLVAALMTGVRLSPRGDSVICESVAFSTIERLVRASAQEEATKTKCKMNSVDNTLLLKLVDAMGKHADNVVKHIELKDSSPAYLFDWLRCRQLLKQRIAFLVIRNHLGSHTARIWMLLIGADRMASPSVATEGSIVYWDDFTVADMVLLPPQEAREGLFRLAENGFIRHHLSDSAVHNLASAANKRTLIFSANEEQSYKTVYNHLLQGLLNFLERKEIESSRIMQLYLRVQSLTEAETKSLRQREVAEDILENYGMMLYDSICVIRDF